MSLFADNIARCDHLLFMSTEDDPELGTVKLQVGEGRESLWGKTKKVKMGFLESLEIVLPCSKAFEYVHTHYFDDVDWFLKADDDTNIIMENLRWSKP